VKSVSADDVPVLVFEGEYSEMLFLKTLIESAGIETSLTSGQTEGGPLNAIFVRPADAEHARELVADFLKNGKRTDPW
jgi:hypothetical protein